MGVPDMRVGFMFVLCSLFVLMCSVPVRANGYIPWDDLTEDVWIDFFDGNDPNIYPVNAEQVDIEDSYPIAFSQAGGGNKAKGMNALKFVHGGRLEGHIVSRDLTGGFDIKNSGDHNIFTMILIVAAINAAELPVDFSLSMNKRGGTAYVLDSNDFGYYDDPYGRPSGYYSITDPNSDGISYAFGEGFVTVYGVSGLGSLGPEESVGIDYSFKSLPGPVVFSVYGYIGTDPVPTIYHTNKAFLDLNDPLGSKNKISTFAVTVPGDLDGDLIVNFVDFAILCSNWLVGAD
jgi:hypothetical protein